MLICIRIFVGFGEGAIFPGCAAMLSTWVPLRERSLGTTAVFSGAIFGSIVGSALSGIILDVIGWRNVFYIFGAISFIWCIIFVGFSFSIHFCRHHASDLSSSGLFSLTVRLIIHSLALLNVSI